MKRLTHLAAGGALLLSQFGAPIPAFAQGNGGAIGIDAAIRNVIQVKVISEAQVRRAILREPVHIGDSVTSGANSALQVLLKDQTVFTVGANARMTIDKFVYDPNRGTGALAASVARGAFRFMSGQAAHSPGQVAIRTPVASIGVRGTIVEVLVGDEATGLIGAIPALKAQAGCKASAATCGDASTATLIVLRGPGPKRVGNDRVGAIDVTANGRTTSVTRAGIVIVSGPGQAPLGPFPLPPAVVAHLNEALSTSPAPQSERETVAQINVAVRNAVRSSTDDAAATLARIVLDNRSTPAALQAALANAAETYDSRSRTFRLLMQASYLVMLGTNTPSVDSIGHALGTRQGTALLLSHTPDSNTDLNQLMTKMATQQVAGATPQGDVVTEWEGSRRRTGDTLLATYITPQIQEPRQASPF